MNVNKTDKIPKKNLCKDHIFAAKDSKSKELNRNLNKVDPLNINFNFTTETDTAADLEQDNNEQSENLILSTFLLLNY